jgi:uncharacterized protein YbcI
MTATSPYSSSTPVGSVSAAAIRLAAADATDGWLARKVARAAGSFEHVLLGRTPTSVTVVGTPGWMVVHLHEPFSPLERGLAAAGEAGARRVREFHHELFNRTAEALCEHVRLATGVSLAGGIAHVDTATGSVLKTLATSTEVDLLLLGAGVPVLGVPVNDHRRAGSPATNHVSGPSRAAGIGAVCR